MRIVAVADTHLDTGGLAIPPGDIFIHAGDLCAYGTLRELEEAAAWMGALPHRHKIVVAGNHDWPFAREPEQARAALGPGVIYLQDQAATIDGVRFWGSPWQPAFADWAFNLPRGPALAEKWAEIPDGLDVLVTHSPPAGFGDRVTLGYSVGCADLLARIDQVRPRLHLFGHIHQDGGLWRHGEIVVANVTTWNGERGATVIDLPPAPGAVQPITVPPARPSRGVP